MYVKMSKSSLNFCPEKARLDVSAVGLWGPLERTFMDVRVVHPNSASYVGKKIEKIYELHEKEKKSK